MLSFELEDSVDGQGLAQAALQLRHDVRRRRLEQNATRVHREGMKGRKQNQSKNQGGHTIGGVSVAKMRSGSYDIPASSSSVSWTNIDFANEKTSHVLLESFDARVAKAKKFANVNSGT